MAIGFSILIFGLLGMWLAFFTMANERLPYWITKIIAFILRQKLIWVTKGNKVFLKQACTDPWGDLVYKDYTGHRVFLKEEGRTITGEKWKWYKEYK